MTWLWIAFAVIAAFAMLSLLSSERQRVLNDRETLRLADEQAKAYALAVEQVNAQAAADPTAGIPTVR